MRVCHCPLDLPLSRTGRAGRDERVRSTVPLDARPAANEYGPSAGKPPSDWAPRSRRVDDPRTNGTVGRVRSGLQPSTRRGVRPYAAGLGDLSASADMGLSGTDRRPGYPRLT